MTSKLYCCTV